MRNVTLLYVFLISIDCACAQPITDVSTKNVEGYRNYRIFSIATTNSGVLLAFAEGRSNLLDHSENDLILKPSIDKGKSWENLIIVDEDGQNALNNPQALVRKDGRIILMYQRYSKNFGEKHFQPDLEGDKICRTLLVYSDDDGINWSKPVAITKQVSDLNQLLLHLALALELRFKTVCTLVVL